MTTLDPPVLRAAGTASPDLRSDPDPHVPRHRRPAGGRPYPELYVSGADFARQIGWLARHGFHAVTLRDAYLHWSFGSSIPTHPVVVTFDDGYHSQFATAAPILASHGWAGVLDLEVRNTTRSWGLSEKQVKLLIADGWELASHTLTHPDLTQIAAAELRAGGGRLARGAPEDVRGARRLLLLPGGQARRDGRRRRASAGYLGATTTAPGLATPADMFRLNRVRVDRSDGVAGLAAKLASLGADAAAASV